MNKQEAEKILKLKSKYNQNALKSSYKLLIKKYHPDLQLTDEAKKQATIQCQKINEAKSYLNKLFETSKQEYLEVNKNVFNQESHSPNESKENKYSNLEEYEYIYNKACVLLLFPNSIHDLELAANLFQQILFYKDSKQLFTTCSILISQYYENLKKRKNEQEKEKHKQDAYEEYKKTEHEKRAKKAEAEAQKRQEKKKEQLRKEKIKQEEERKRREEETRRGVKEFNEKMFQIKKRIKENEPFDWEVTFVLLLVGLFILSLLLNIIGFDYLTWKDDITGQYIRFDWKNNIINPSEFDNYYYAVASNIYSFMQDSCILLVIPPFLIVLLSKFIVTKVRNRFNKSLDPMFLTRFNKALIIAVFCPIICSRLLYFNNSIFELLKTNVFWNLPNEKFAFELYYALLTIFMLISHFATYFICRKINKICDNNFRGTLNNKFWRRISRSPILETFLCIFLSFIVTWILMLIFIM